MAENLLCDGRCPECLRKGVKSIIVENSTKGFWECPTCNLQLQMLSPDYLGILDERGEGKFKSISYDKEKWGDRILLRKPQFDGDDCVIKNTDELDEYLSGIF